MSWQLQNLIRLSKPFHYKAISGNFEVIAATLFLIPQR